MKLINVDDIDWQKGVFVNPTTDYPMDRTIHVSRNEVLKILDKLIESEEK